MPEPEDPHRYFDELTAGYALGALEPAEQGELVSHLSRCPVCERSLAGFAEVTAAVAEAVPPTEPRPELRSHILAAAREAERQGDREPVSAGQAAGGGADGAGRAAALIPAGPVRPLRGRTAHRQTARRGTVDHRTVDHRTVDHRAGRRWAGRRWASVAAAAAAVAIAMGTAGGLLASRSGPSPEPLAACVQAGQCPQVVLTSAHGHRVAARLVVRGQTVWLLPGSLPPDNTGRQVYVLWQITGAHIPLSVGSFDIRHDAGGPVKIGTLAIPYHGTWAFAISLEHGRTIPAKPSQPVALGQVPV